MTLDVRLRRYQTSDIDRMYDAVVESRRELARWMPWCHEHYSRDDTAIWVESRSGAWEQNEAWCFVIVDANDRMLGACGLLRLDLKHNQGELGYWVRSTATKQGVATEAARQLLHYGFEEANLERIEIVMSVENLASQRVAENASAVREGILRERFKLNGRRHDCLMYSVLRHEWLS